MGRTNSGVCIQLRLLTKDRSIPFHGSVRSFDYMIMHRRMRNKVWKYLCITKICMWLCICEGSRGRWININ